MRTLLACLRVALLLCGLASAVRAGQATFEVRAVAPRLGLPGTSETVLDDGGGDPVTLPLGSEVLLDTTALVSAEAKTEDGFWFIAVELNAVGKARLAEITARYEGRRLAFLINGKARCAPVVRSPILDGSFEIAGNFTEEEVKALAADLNAAARAALATPSNP